jgi:hypothetical protein
VGQASCLPVENNLRSFIRGRLEAYPTYQ